MTETFFKISVSLVCYHDIKCCCELCAMSVTEEKHLFQQDCGYTGQWLQRGLFAFKVTLESNAENKARSWSTAKEHALITE